MSPGAAVKAQVVLAVLGPIFLLAGGWRLLGPHRQRIQGMAWVLVGAIFTGVAGWLHAG